MYNADSNRYAKMKYNRCGNSGLRLPAVSLGFWHNFGDGASFENMKEMCFTAFDNGVTYFDLANNYGPVAGAAERNFGKIFNENMRAYRDEIIVSTKAGYLMWDGPYGDFGSRKYLLSSLDRSLERLGLDYVDIFYHHRPDPDTSLDETMGALAQAVNSGKALYVGLSNYDGETLIRAAEILEGLKCPFVVNQNYYNIFDRTIEKDGLIDGSRRLKKGVVAYCPLAQGLLSDRYLKGIPSDSRVKSGSRFLTEASLTADKLERVRKLDKIASDRGQTLSQMALSWILRNDSVTSVLTGASRPSQILSNIKAVSSAPFSDDELFAISEIGNCAEE